MGDDVLRLSESYVTMEHEGYMTCASRMFRQDGDLPLSLLQSPDHLRHSSTATTLVPQEIVEAWASKPT